MVWRMIDLPGKRRRLRFCASGRRYSMPSSRRREPARDRAMLLIVQAIREGWDSHKLAKEAKICTNTASDVLATVSKSIVDSKSRELGLTVRAMQREAERERPLVVTRMRSLGSVADRLASVASSLLDRIESGEAEDDEDEDESEDDGGKKSNRRKRSPLIETRLAALGSAIKAASAASADSWACFKDASGLSFAETAAVHAMKSTGKKTGAPLVPTVLVELDDSGEREDS